MTGTGESSDGDAKPTRRWPLVFVAISVAVLGGGAWLGWLVSQPASVCITDAALGFSSGGETADELAAMAQRATPEGADLVSSSVDDGVHRYRWEKGDTWYTFEFEPSTDGSEWTFSPVTTCQWEDDFEDDQRRLSGQS